MARHTFLRSLFFFVNVVDCELSLQSILCHGVRGIQAYIKSPYSLLRIPKKKILLRNVCRYNVTAMCQCYGVRGIKAYVKSPYSPLCVPKKRMYTYVCM